VCLQNELRVEDQAWLAGQGDIAYFGPDLVDFSQTAALVEALDLVVTVDTSIAHLAGALGKQVWVLVPFKPDWRWLLGRNDSPWYPSMRLFRQTQRGDWQAPLAQIDAALGAA
jgi:ADP-heptose:LPS heptosyltransferase